MKPYDFFMISVVLVLAATIAVVGCAKGEALEGSSDLPSRISKFTDGQNTCYVHGSHGAISCVRDGGGK